jgi:hypothetical protein
VLPYVGPLPLTAITRERVKGLVADMVKRGNLKSEDRQSAPRTVQAAMQTVVAILDSAVEDGLLPSNPAARWGRVVRQDQQQVEEIEVFTPDELTRLLGATERDCPDYYPFVLCLARTGMRLRGGDGAAVAGHRLGGAGDPRPPLHAARGDPGAQERQGPPGGHEPAAHGRPADLEEPPGGQGGRGRGCDARVGVPARPGRRRGR